MGYLYGASGAVICRNRFSIALNSSSVQLGSWKDGHPFSFQRTQASSLSRTARMALVNVRCWGWGWKARSVRLKASLSFWTAHFASSGDRVKGYNTTRLGVDICASLFSFSSVVRERRCLITTIIWNNTVRRNFESAIYPLTASSEGDTCRSNNCRLFRNPG